MHTEHLIDRNPVVSTEELLAGLRPSPRFGDVSFASYRPDPQQPSQQQAVDALESFAQKIPASGKGSAGKYEKKRLFRRFRTGAAQSSDSGRAGIYLDGGFGVGKTHLLASLWHEASGPKAFGTFVEYTNLVGAMSFRKAVDALQQYSVVCIDEFELDDPGDTVLMSRLMRELADAGVKLAATSNTLPGALGEGRFAAQDFRREIQVLAEQFEVLRIDGEDYRHRGLPKPPEPVAEDDLLAVAQHEFEGLEVAEDDFEPLLAHLGKVHPSRYRQLIAGVQGAVWHQVETIADQSTALRFVVLVDRLYDQDVPILASGASFDQIFTPEMMAGGYQKKYYRTVSRLTALAREGQSASLG